LQWHHDRARDGSVHAASVDAIFEAARRAAPHCWKVMMDRNCPDDLRDTAESGIADSLALIQRWHGRERLHYAITPRFAPTSSSEQLAAAGRLAREHPDVFVHTHVAENEEEVAWVQRLFPERRSYLDVYDHYGLLRRRALLAHGIWLDETDLARLAECTRRWCTAPRAIWSWAADSSMCAARPPLACAWRSAPTWAVAPASACFT
jgi:guanine deaminase